MSPSSYRGDWAVARPYPHYAAYFPSKGAIAALTRSLAVELAMRNPRVRVNCIMPGPVLLPLDLPEAERQHAIQGTLLKREGRPENIAFPRQIAMFLARQLTESSLNTIGEAFGGRDHGTVLHACRLVEDRMEVDANVRQVVNYLEKQLQR